MKKVLKIIGIVLGVIVVLLAALLIKNAIDANKPYLSDAYYQDFKSDFPLELKYAQRGTFEVSKVVIKSSSKSIGNITVFYPIELETSNRTWPLILNVNASNTRVRNTVPFFERLASWGFIVVGNDDPQAGTGETASATLDVVLQVDESNVLHGKIDRENMAVIGYSQRGAGAINAATNLITAVSTRRCLPAARPLGCSLPEWAGIMMFRKSRSLISCAQEQDHLMIPATMRKDSIRAFLLCFPKKKTTMASLRTSLRYAAGSSVRNMAKCSSIPMGI